MSRKRHKNKVGNAKILICDLYARLKTKSKFSNSLKIKVVESGVIKKTKTTKKQKTTNF